MAQILVTGGLGFIGSHTAVELIKAGHEPVLIDDLSNSTASVLDGIEGITSHRPVFERVDLKSKSEVRDFFGRYSSLDGIIHFAAYLNVNESLQKNYHHLSLMP